MKREPGFFTRYEGNPILTPKIWPYSKVARVFNPGAIRVKNKTLLLVRVKDMQGFSHLTSAWSEDGKTNWEIDSQPTLEASLSEGESETGLEDARIVWLEGFEYVISCVSFRTDFIKNPCTVSLISTSDFSAFERISKPLVPLDKNACLFPRKIKNKFVLIHRPSIDGQTCIAISFSSDLKHWGMVRPILSPRAGTWCNYRVGLATQPIETLKGWLIIYHGSEDIASRISYKVGLALLDLETLEVIRRSNDWVFAPAMGYEGGPNGIVFPCGVIAEDDKLRMYYGANDYSVCLATAKLNNLIDYLWTECPEK